ncbi:hypothetical protein Mal4_50820 [Maioricimonas rarisocia]|uniref:DUF1501 domain-containing protein n=1 Tax=Maioricimonas rarisocia TaxID=2528026 RepID=A0A517ZE09_9PLAN|nr:DUF1501 domain-containing protein [Maioricimonas rarisocia]QDU40722.1 hypothetical protein Mal4_50820 [Maioricimonas rarisocia]
MALHRTCDGLKRRDFLRVGALGVSGVTLGSFLRLSEAGQVAGAAKARSAIFINLPGGPSHMDTFDLKPNASDEYRGEFSPIQTKVPGIEISEHLPRLASAMDKFVILRGVSHTLAAHRLGSEYVNTGNKPLPSLEFPGYGAVVTREMGGPQDLPPFVSIPNSNQRAGYLGVKYAPLHTNSTPQPGRPFSVRGISLEDGLTIEDVEKRNNLLSKLDTTFAGFEKHNQLLDGLDRFSQQAYSMITSKRAREAFDVSKEAPSFAGKFGESPFGQSCLLATRLVEAGTRFVTISTGGWDTHRDNWGRLKERQLPPFDEGLAALLVGLEEKGLLDSTAVYVTGEFGRTPKINQERGGRDHYPRCMFMLMAGGGIQGGRVLGASNENATEPAGDGFSPDDVAASFYHSLGIDHTKEYHTNTGRPVMIVRNGNVIDELFA